MYETAVNTGEELIFKINNAGGKIKNNTDQITAAVTIIVSGCQIYINVEAMHFEKIM